MFLSAIRKHLGKSSNRNSRNICHSFPLTLIQPPVIFSSENFVSLVWIMFSYLQQIFLSSTYPVFLWVHVNILHSLSLARSCIKLLLSIKNNLILFSCFFEPGSYSLFFFPPNNLHIWHLGLNVSWLLIYFVLIIFLTEEDWGLIIAIISLCTYTSEWIWIQISF